MQELAKKVLSHLRILLKTAGFRKCTERITHRRTPFFDQLETRRLLATFGITPQYDVEVTPDIIYRDDAKVGYGTNDGVTDKSLKLDLYQPTGDNLPETLPAAILIHGGGFVGGDKAQGTFVDLSNDFASRGYVAVSINYRLFGDSPPPAKETQFSDLDERYDTFVAGVEDAFHAVKWMKDSADTLGIDPNRIMLGGHSAGGFLSLATGMFDAQDVSEFSYMDLDISQLQVAALLDGAGSMNGTEYTIDANDPPTFILHSEDDATVTYDNAQKIATELGNHNVAYEFPLITTAGHGLDEKLDTVVDGVVVSDQMFAFFEQKLDLDELIPTFNWHNENLSEDVNGDGSVTPFDALMLINELNNAGAYQLPLSKPGESPFYDVNKDGWITPSDVIQVINVLNSGPHSAAFSLSLTDVNNEPTSNISVDEVFYINLSVEDISAAEAGVFAAYVDLYIPETHLEYAGNAEFTAPYTNAPSGTVNNGSELDEWGAFAGLDKVGSGSIVVSRIPVRAIASGSALLVLEPADESPFNDVLIYDRATPLDALEVVYRSFEFNILENAESEYINELAMSNGSHVQSDL